MDLKLFQGSSSKDAPKPPPGQAPNVKNYFFIYEKDHPQIDLSRYESSRGEQYHGKLFLSITTLQDIFIGSGEIDRKGSHLFDVFSFVRTGSGLQIWNIPGSSLKGCICTHLEMFLQRRFMDVYSAQKGKAKVFFSDLPMTAGAEAAGKEITARFPPQAVPEKAIYKLYKKEYHKDSFSQGRFNSEPGKERLQAIKTGSRFESYIHFKELDEYEITLLILALGSMPGNTFNFKIGGAKNRAMGLVKLQIDFDKSFYARTLKDIAVKNVHPFTGLMSAIEKTLSRLKQDFPALDPLLKKIQGEYRQ